LRLRLARGWPQSTRHDGAGKLGNLFLEKLNIRQIEAFRAVMTYGSMKKAAEVLGISQPAMSRLIASLTETVGFALFTREQGGVVPTDDAVDFMREVERVFAGTDELRRRADAIRRKEAGTVRIAAMSHYANDLLPELVARFSLKHPNIRVILEARSRIEIGSYVRLGLADLGVTSLPIPSEPAVVTRLAVAPVVLLMPAGHPLSAMERVPAEALEGERFVSFESRTPFRTEVDAVFDERSIRRTLAIETAAPEGIVRLVAAGAGVGLISPFTADIHETPGVVSRPFDPAVAVEVGLLTDDRSLSTAATAMIDFLKEAFEDGTATARYRLPA